MGCNAPLPSWILSLNLARPTACNTPMIRLSITRHCGIGHSHSAKAMILKERTKRSMRDSIISSSGRMTNGASMRNKLMAWQKREAAP